MISLSVLGSLFVTVVVSLISAGIENGFG
jgi:hypothetical protein